MAIYGDMLSFFPEQFRSVEYFAMKPLPRASYTQRESLGSVRGVFQFLKKGELKRENETLADEEVPTFWTHTDLKVGNFVSFGGVDYRILDPDEWLFEGGFKCYVLETVVGNTDKQTSHPYVNLGQHNYA